MADLNPRMSEPIDLIIGADLYGELILDGLRKGATNEPIAQRTALGWIISGSIDSEKLSTSNIQVHHYSIDSTLDDTLRRFWEIEELPRRPCFTNEEIKCEQHFVATHSRSPDGRYVVRFPFRPDPPLDLGESRASAYASLLRSERQLRFQSEKSTAYADFLAEYERLRHIAKVTDSDRSESQKVYIPHHAVFRETSTTTRLRVVFNASSSTSNGKSLNDHLMLGPKLQTELSSVILLWRQWRYVYTADIAKMYRQILIDKRDLDYQRILWRATPNGPVDAYQVLTVTYGTASAPYQALRVLKQLVLDEGTQYPLAVPILRRNIYVDDCVFGADTLDQARKTREQLCQLLAKGCFKLRKWASNHPSLITDIPSDEHELACSKTLVPGEHVTILGIVWFPEKDAFKFKINLPTVTNHTKRAVLSTVAKIFDPLGWATPVVIRAKIFMQQLWALKCSWDDDLPPSFTSDWSVFRRALPRLEQLVIPRWTNYGPDNQGLELHGFADASIHAYAAVVYLRVVASDGSARITLLAAKSRVAPLKPITIPRLELSAALLLAQLMHHMRSTLEITIDCYAWTDSTITLAWIKKPASTWKTFVANRVAEIHNLLPDGTWNDIATDQNPADCGSRGIDPDELLSHKLWWTGPSWLELPSSEWPTLMPGVPDAVPIEQKITCTVKTVASFPAKDLDSRYSSWFKLLRVTSYIFRFSRRARKSSTLPRYVESEATLRTLESWEIDIARTFWLKHIQAELFPTELACLKRSAPIAKSSSLSAFTPFLDDDGLIRVRGLLQHSDLSASAKRPIILRSHPLVSLIIFECHLNAKHAGPTLTLALLRQEYWILRARTVIRSVLHRCVPCCRAAAPVPSELMGDLPTCRVTRSTRAFQHIGVDYAGPILVRTSPGRGHKSRKSYIAVFICMAVKAVHLELVSDYSAAAFIATFNRFISRRGIPTRMYSDNGTTFHGAEREVNASSQAAIRDDQFRHKLTVNRVEWSFLLPNAPHFGGLWEAAVRSVKHHLKRSIGSYTLTFEELTPLLCQIEACLNSRPLGDTSDHISDYNVLTPGHFLIGEALMSIPTPSVLDISENRLSRWQLLQRVTEVFWKPWSTSYIQTLQQRPKWRVRQNLATIGRIVLLRNPSAPPSQWELGTIIACHPGDDGCVRVVTVKTAHSQFKRPIMQLCFLPIDINEESQNDAVMAGGNDLATATA